MARTLWVGPDRSWPTLGWSIVSWIERTLCHGPGDVEGEPIELDDEFAQFVLDCYRLHPPRSRRAGRRAVSNAELSRAKGRAKSELAGMLVCVEFVAPCRFDHWAERGEVSYWGYEYEPGEPVGRPVHYPVIRPLATEEGQTGNTYDNVVVMLRHAVERFPRDPYLDRLDIGDTRIYRGRATDGKIIPSTASSKSKDGGKESFAVADETHLYDLPALVGMYSTVERNTGKRKAAEPWMLTTTTSYEPGAGSVAELIAGQAERVAAGIETAPGLLYDHREAEGPKDWHNDAQLRAAIEDAQGAFAEHADIDAKLANCRKPTQTEAESRRYELNQRGKGESRPIDLDAWDELADPSRNPTPGREVVLGFDGSDRGANADDTVLVGWTVEARPHLFLIGRWARPPRAGTDYRVPRGEINRVVSDVRDDYRVSRLVFDPPYWTVEGEAWAADFGVDYAGEPIVEDFPTNSSARMGPAIDRFLEMLDGREFTHDGSPELRWYAGNVHLAQAKGAGRYPALTKPPGKKADKIDGIVAAVLSLPAVCALLDEGGPIDLVANVH